MTAQGTYPWAAGYYDDGDRPKIVTSRFGYEDSHTIGRLSDCTVVVSDTNTSRHHARITRSGTGFVVADLNSTNGTFVNGERLLADHRLEDGDIVTVGSVSLRFEAF